MRSRLEIRRRRAACVALACGLGALFLLTGCSRGTPEKSDTSSEERKNSRGERGDPLHPVVAITTNLGEFRVELDGVKAPGTVRNFLNYVGDGFYAGTQFHYVEADTMILGGGYTADGRPKPTGASVRNEAHNGLKNVRGTIAMARDAAAGIDSATSQFFINLKDAPTLDHRGESADEYGYCVFGKVVEGLDVAEQISHSPTRDQGGDLVRSPDPPVLIESIRVVE